MIKVRSIFYDTICLNQFLLFWLYILLFIGMYHHLSSLHTSIYIYTYVLTHTHTLTYNMYRYFSCYFQTGISFYTQKKHFYFYYKLFFFGIVMLFLVLLDYLIIY